MTNKPEVGKKYEVIDGGRDKPNGKLLVTVLQPDSEQPGIVQRFFLCLVLEVKRINGAVPSIGSKLFIHYDQFDKEVA